ncbi:MAG TPA: ABC transporter transmembrane domain-containing protein [Chloroflexia bacterium]
MARPMTLKQTIPGFWRIMRRFWPYLRKQRKLMAGSFVALFAEVGLRLLEPWPLKFVFDRVIPQSAKATSSGIPWLDSLDVRMLLLVSAVGIVLITAVRALAAYFNTVGFAMLGTRVLARTRSDVYNHIQRLSLSYHTKARSGDLVVRIISDVGQLKDVAVTALLPMLANVLILVGMLALMLLLQWQLTLLALAVAPLFALSTVRISRRIQDAARKQRKREGAMAATASESISAIRVVQALSLEDTLAESFFSQNKQSLKQDVKSSKLAASLERTVDVLIALATGLVLWQGANLVLEGALSAGELLVFLTYLKNGFKPVRDFAKYTGRLAKATAAGERVMDVLEQEPDVRNMPGAAPAPALRGAVRFNNVAFEYEPGHPVLRDINLDVRPGQHIALVGASGNGKSTLVSLIMRLYDPTEGSVLLDGLDVREYTIDSVRSQISVVMQDTILFAASVRDNIAYGSPEATEEEIEAAARLANAHDFIQAMPEGYDTLLGERGATLSNGQRQRISIARAAIRRAPIVILDEPTTGLDEENERVVMEALDRLSRGRTTFLITHKLSQARNAETIVVLQEGSIVEQGTHAELMRAGGAYRKLYTGESLAGPGVEIAVPAASPAPAPAVHIVVAGGGDGGDASDTGSLQTNVAPVHETQLESANELKAQPNNSKETDKARKPSAWRRSFALMLAVPAVVLALVAAAINANATGSATNGASTAAQSPAGSAATSTAPARQPVPTALADMQSHVEATVSGGVVQSTSVVTYSGYLTGVASLAWSPDNRTLALGSTDDVARLLDTQTGVVSMLKGHTKDVYLVTWSPDGSRLATGGFDNRVRVWTAGGQLVSTHGDHSGIIAGLTWLQDGRSLASVSTNMQIIQWDADSDSQVFAAKGEGDFLYNVMWSPDGSVMAAGSHNTVRLWNRDGKLLNAMPGHTAEIFCIAWSPDGKMLATGSNDDTVRLWSADGKAVATLAGHTEFINGVAWSPDGKTLASGAFDKTVRLWDATGKHLGTLAAGAEVVSVAWSPDGKSLAAVLLDGTVWVWKLA